MVELVGADLQRGPHTRSGVVEEDIHRWQVGVVKPALRSPTVAFCFRKTADDADISNVPCTCVATARGTVYMHPHSHDPFQLFPRPLRSHGHSPVRSLSSP